MFCKNSTDKINFSATCILFILFYYLIIQMAKLKCGEMLSHPRSLYSLMMPGGITWRILDDALRHQLASPPHRHNDNDYIASIITNALHGDFFLSKKIYSLFHFVTSHDALTFLQLKFKIMCKVQVYFSNWIRFRGVGWGWILFSWKTVVPNNLWGFGRIVLNKKYIFLISPIPSYANSAMISKS